MRATILARPERFQAALEQAEAAGFVIEGEAYAPRGWTQWIARKSAYLVGNHPLEPLLFSPDLIDHLKSRWRALAPLYELLG